MSPITHYLLDQFRHPRGPLGHLAGTIMAHRRSNIDRNKWTVDLLDLTPDARVLVSGLSEKRCKRRFPSQLFSAVGIRSAKVIAKALSAGFQRMVHRVWPVPLGSSDRVTR